MKHPEFEVHILNDEGVFKAKKIATLFDDFLDDLDEVIKGSGREWSLVKTKLEEASFFAKKALAIRPSNQKEQS